jgi:endogenous inhibitor of DNA gyrase (YacG/DUF329 family)
MEIIHAFVPEDELERDVNITIKVNSGSRPDLDDQKESMIYVESKPKSEPHRTLNWNDFEGMFIYWILPIILVIIVIIVMGFLIHKQRKEHKEDMKIIQEMREQELAEEYDREDTDIYAGSGPGAPTIPGTIPSSPVRARPRRAHRKRQTRPRPPTLTPKRVGVGKGAEVKWLDKEPVAPLPPREKLKHEEEDLTKIECPACGKLVDIDEYKCPYCGEMFEDFEKEEKVPTFDLDEDYKVHLPEEDEGVFEEAEEFEEEELEWEEPETEAPEEELSDEKELEELEELEPEPETDEGDEEEIDWELEE